MVFTHGRNVMVFPQFDGILHLLVDFFKNQVDMKQEAQDQTKNSLGRMIHGARIPDHTKGQSLVGLDFLGIVYPFHGKPIALQERRAASRLETAQEKLRLDRRRAIELTRKQLLKQTGELSRGWCISTNSTVGDMDVLKIGVPQNGWFISWKTL